ncbi:NDP-hexose 2,3-dehydratase family protein [Streptomyces sp. MA25(2023)]|uniref:NDP-hexose 2,3-dehydratase family protein n=1 Tax=Streptomyces sp. MA25(2023) TaxID=3055078 RepID=UPI0025B20978|nr:NDP-hexose 2,3-dehydratase family protein [Streptomyces sp. MA25(2023)]MDN3255278.1 NDP-hexose 2,3-dehydratase family protein [Streptomyces sp. MA25(2023)]
MAVSAPARRLLRSAEVTDSGVTPLDDLRARITGDRAVQRMSVTRIPFAEMRGWRFESGTHNLVHDSGRFYSVEGLRAEAPQGAVRAWTQPILRQPETAILGILATEIHGVLHFLMQAKAEPGNRGGVQLSPTVQATRSNYTRVHKGRAVPYVEYFRGAAGRQVLVDARLSEQGNWFHQKRNRNIVVEVPSSAGVESRPDHHWLTLGQLHVLLAEEELINMDARSVLACLPWTGLRSGEERRPRDSYGTGGAHGTDSLLRWLNRMRAQLEGSARLVPLRELERWERYDDRISHESGRFFDIVAVEVEARGRETARWSQPLLAPRGTGVAGFLLRHVDGVPHVLVQARTEPGYVDVAELGPTVQFNPGNVQPAAGLTAPPLAAEILGAPAGRVRFDTVLAEEGGRFQHALNRYLIVEEDPARPVDELPTHRWVTVRQLVGLMRHSGYVNVEARTLVAALKSLKP